MGSTAKSDIAQFLDEDRQKELLRFMTAGSVDDGKSTLIGRLLVDSKALYDDQLLTLVRDSRRHGSSEGQMEYSLLLDGLKAEREQGITIDVAYRYFSTPRRKFILADTPGHEQYTRNMVTGGSTASVAVLLIDAQRGLTAQTQRHARLVHLLGIRHVLFAINKMDLVGYSPSRYHALVEECNALVAPLAIPDTTYIPVSAKYGDNVVAPSRRMAWYEGTTLLSYLETVRIEQDYNMDALRFPVQYVVHTEGMRGLCGKVASGILRQGMEVVALPSMQKTHIKTILTYDGTLVYAAPPQSVTVVVADDLDISRGEMLVPADGLPLISQHIKATMVWMDEEASDANKAYYIKQTTALCRAYLSGDSPALHLNDIATIRLTAARSLFFDPYTTNKATGAFILIDPISHNTCAAGMILSALNERDVAAAHSRLSLSLTQLGIAPQQRSVAEKIAQALSQQGISITIEE